MQLFFITTLTKLHIYLLTLTVTYLQLRTLLKVSFFFWRQKKQLRNYCFFFLVIYISIHG